MTTGLVFAHNCLILDASCVINLYASGQMAPILITIPCVVAVAGYVREQEALRVYSQPEEDGTRKPRAIDLEPLIAQGLLNVSTHETEAENESYVNFAALLGDDGESVTVAIALHRNWAIGIDDRRARNLFRRQVPHLQLISTPELLKHWVDTAAPPPETVRYALENVRIGAKYSPGPSHPLFGWWNSSLEAE